MNEPDPTAAAKEKLDAHVAALAGLVFTIGIALEPVKDAVDGYRRDFERRGFTNDAASMMAAALHDELMKAALHGIAGAPKASP